MGIYSLLFIKDLYTTNASDLKILNSNLDLQTTSLFLENLLQSSVNHTTQSNEISFYEINKEDFKNNLYSGLALLGKSSKEYVSTPQSLISKVDAKYIWFNKEYFYEIQNGFEDDKIYFTNKIQAKRIYEQYTLLKQQSFVYVKNNTLYFNHSILLKNIHSFESRIKEGKLFIHICTQQCQKWIINL